MKLEIFEIDGTENKQKYWNIFKAHHYLTDNLPVASRCFVGYLDGVLVAFSSYYVFPNGSVRKYMASSRHVVLPDYQGIGIGTKMIEFVAEYLRRQGFKPYIKSTSYKLKQYIQSDVGAMKWLNLGINVRKWSDNFFAYRIEIPKGKDPRTYTKPFKVYDHHKMVNDEVVHSDKGDNSYHWINRESISARYVGYDYFKKKHVLIFMETLYSKKNDKLYTNIFDELNPKYYYEVYNGSSENNTDDQLFTDKYHLDSYALRDGKKHDIRWSKLKNMDYSIYSKIIYIYNDKNKQLLPFVDELADNNNVVKYKLCNDYIDIG